MSARGPWWSRWLGGGGPPNPAAAGSPVPPPAAAGPAAPVAAPPGTPPGVMRRPLIGRDGRVAAFEWHATAGRTPALRLALCRAAAADTRPGLVAVDRLELDNPALRDTLPAGLWLALDGLPDNHLAASLAARGLHIGAPAAAPVAEPALDFVVATDTGGGMDTLLLAEQRWRELQPRIRAVALGLTSLDDAEMLLAQGYHWVGGRFSRGARAPVQQPLGAPAHRICLLLSRLAQDADTLPLAEAVRADAVLGYRLLRYANSASVGLRNPAETVEQAIAVLGRRELTRWLQLMLLSAAAARPAQRGLQEHTLMRARLLERLAMLRGESEPGAFFTLGLMSTMEQLLQAPLATTLAPLRLREEAQQALLARRGPWAAQLDLLDALEDPDERRLWSLAESLGHRSTLTPEAEAAWAWASAVQALG